MQDLQGLEAEMSYGMQAEVSKGDDRPWTKAKPARCQSGRTTTEVYFLRHGLNEVSPYGPEWGPRERNRKHSGKRKAYFYTYSLLFAD